MRYFFLFLLGLAVGSFFNVIAFRFKEGKFLFSSRVLWGRSRCRSCRRTLTWYELIPLLSFFWQGGRCRACGHKLSYQYPLIELIAGLIPPLVVFYFFDYRHLEYINLILSGQSAGLYAAIFLWVVVFLLLLLLSLIDYREYLIPDELSYIFVALGIGWIALLTYLGSAFYADGSFLGQYQIIFEVWQGVWANHLLGALVGVLIIGAIYYLSRRRAIGFGDIVLLGALGLLFGYPDIVVIILLSFVLGAAVSLVLIARREKGMKDFVPFAPFVALSAWLVFFYGADIMRWYLSLLNPFRY